MSAAVNQLRQHFDRELTERQFQQAVVSLARVTGWKQYHTFRSDHSPAGFLDLVLVKDGRIIFAELKRQGGKVTPEQMAWLDELRKVELAATGCAVLVYLWRPSDWGQIEAVLTGIAA